MVLTSTLELAALPAAIRLEPSNILVQSSRDISLVPTAPCPLFFPPQPGRLLRIDSQGEWHIPCRIYSFLQSSSVLVVGCCIVRYFFIFREQSNNCQSSNEDRNLLNIMGKTGGGKKGKEKDIL